MRGSWNYDINLVWAGCNDVDGDQGKFGGRKEYSLCETA